MAIFAGVDCHKHKHTIAFLSSSGELLRCVTIDANDVGYDQGVAAAREYGEVIWGLEGSGFYGRAFARYLVAAGARVFEVPGAVTKRHRRQSSHRGKSDPIDARAIAEAVLRESGRLPAFAEIGEQKALRRRYDQRDRFVQERSKAINRLRGAALQLGLKKLPKSLATTTAACSISAQARKLKTALGDEPLLDEITFAAQDIALLNKRIARLEAELKSTILRVGPNLLSVFGISFVLAAGLIGHSGDMQNTRNASAYAMMSGTAPIPCSSGMNSSVRVNPGGNRKLNRALHTVALVQSRCPRSPGYAYYQRKKQEGRTPRAALRALKRRLATVVYYRLVEAQNALTERTDRSAAA